jgi:hypothetical protein
MKSRELLEFSRGREDALWLLIGTPIVLGVLALVVSPLSWLIGRAA